LAEHLPLALRCSPQQALNWYYYSVYGAMIGYPTSGLYPALLTSYRLAPREAWLMTIRNPFAARLASAGPAELRTAVDEEFVALVEHGVLNGAVRSYALADPARRAELSYMIRKLPRGALRRLEKRLEAHQIFIELAPPPWRR
jgi:hypothetical protein